MPQYDGTEVLTIGLADAAKRAAEEWSDKRGYPAPTMYKPGHEGPMWVLWLEGYGDWALGVSGDSGATWPPGVFAEPVNDQCLGLYPAPDPAVSGEGARLAAQWETATAQGNQWAQQRIGAEMARFLNEH